MSIVTFVNRDRKETGQSMSISAIATLFAIEHNYRILLISTDFIDATIENAFWNNNARKFINPFANTKSFDISNGMEGLIRTFASNRASEDMIKSYTKPILKDRLDVLAGPKTMDYKEYCTISTYFSQIAEVASSAYDIVLIDLSRKVPLENQNKLLNISNLIVFGLNQTLESMNNFNELKNSNDFFKKSSVILSIGKYDSDSKYTNKNIARYLKEKDIPLIIPYNILFNDSCSEGKIVDYMLMARAIQDEKSKDYYFYNSVTQTVNKIDYKRQETEYNKF